MSGIDGYYFEDDWGGKYYPGRIFSCPDVEDPDEPGYYLMEDRDVSDERDFWQEVSAILQENYGLGAYQARKKIYELEERFMGASPEVVKLNYHYSPRRIAEEIMEYKE